MVVFYFIHRMNIIIMSQTIPMVGLRTKLNPLCREDVCCKCEEYFLYRLLVEGKPLEKNRQENR